MLLAVAAGAVLLGLAMPASATCPPDCVGGGGSPATDCFVEFGGIVATEEACTDGNASCDMDQTVNGVCTFPISACVGVSGDPRCVPRALSRTPTVRPMRNPAARALAESLAALGPSGGQCTAPGLAVPLAATLKGLRASVARLTITATAGGRRDRNRLKLTCRTSPAPPSLTATIRPIFQARCALPACHDGGPGSIAPTLAGPDLASRLVDVPAANVPALALVRPGVVMQSYLARKVLGKRIPDRTPRMPQGCPIQVPAGGCLTNGEIAAIIAWIQTGAPDN